MSTNDKKTLSREIGDDPELRMEVEREWFADSVIIKLEQKMDEMGLTRKELARRMNCSAANVSQLLRHGRSNLTLDTLMDLALAMEHRFLAPVLEPVSAAAPWESCHVQTFTIEHHGGWKEVTEPTAAETSVSVSVSWVHRELERETEGLPEMLPYTPQESGEIHVH